MIINLKIYKLGKKHKLMKIIINWFKWKNGKKIVRKIKLQVSNCIVKIEIETEKDGSRRKNR